MLPASRVAPSLDVQHKAFYLLASNAYYNPSCYDCQFFSPLFFFDYPFFGQCYYSNMNFVYYFKDCPTCQNHARNLVREAALHTNTHLDERYILALPDVWGKAVNTIGTPVPFLYNPATKASLHIDPDDPEMYNLIKSFFENSSCP